MVHTVAVHRRRHRVPISTLAAALVVAIAVGAGACSDDGRTLAPVRPGQTTTTQAPPGPGTGQQASFALHSDAAADSGVLRDRFTCDDGGVSPDLRWSGTPPGAELAIVVRERDGGLVHWLVTGIDPLVEGFGEGGLPEGAEEQPNGTGVPGWLAPCPDLGRHVYEIVLHVLAEPSEIDPAEPAGEVAAGIESASTAQARLSVVVEVDD